MLKGIPILILLCMTPLAYGYVNPVETVQQGYTPVDLSNSFTWHGVGDIGALRCITIDVPQGKTIHSIQGSISWVKLNMTSGLSSNSYIREYAYLVKDDVESPTANSACQFSNGTKVTINYFNKQGMYVPFKAWQYLGGECEGWIDDNFLNIETYIPNGYHLAVVMKAENYDLKSTLIDYHQQFALIS